MTSTAGATVSQGSRRPPPSLRDFPDFTALSLHLTGSELLAAVLGTFCVCTFSRSHIFHGNLSWADNCDSRSGCACTHKLALFVCALLDKHAVTSDNDCPAGGHPFSLCTLFTLTPSYIYEKKRNALELNWLSIPEDFPSQGEMLATLRAYLSANQRSSFNSLFLYLTLDSFLLSFFRI